MENSLDLNMVQNTRSLWENFINWCDLNMSDVDDYCERFPKLLMDISLVDSTNKGLTKVNVIDKLIEQGRGDTILHLQATIKLSNKYLKTQDCMGKMGTPEGKKEIYLLLKDFLTF